ncbi:hypothetical protein GALMADRAFT_549584 [Galerina marginata CBS 339.88]|uniref:Uncharacterized protein n=1 Tax=Galerina marginata (strain CBS 339.88) TaxID=685588 RepID=A0A067SWN2_GALM3|nr:hypothetical protein GALMADRAFT_549584 [Galerina marginata CBS 339.88]
MLDLCLTFCYTRILLSVFIVLSMWPKKARWEKTPQTMITIRCPSIEYFMSWSSAIRRLRFPTTKTIDNDVLTRVMSLLDQAGEKLAKNAPNLALGYLRSAIKTYLAFVPGAGFAVDKFFDSLGDVVGTHAEEATTIAQKAHRDILDVLQKSGNDRTTTDFNQIVNVTLRLIIELQDLGVKRALPNCRAKL